MTPTQKTKEHAMSCLLFLMTDKTLPLEARERANYLNKFVAKLSESEPWPDNVGQSDSNNDADKARIAMLTKVNEQLASENKRLDAKVTKLQTQLQTAQNSERDAESMHVSERAALAKQIEALKQEKSVYVVGSDLRDGINEQLLDVETSLNKIRLLLLSSVKQTPPTPKATPTPKAEPTDSAPYDTLTKKPTKKKRGFPVYVDVEEKILEFLNNCVDATGAEISRALSMETPNAARQKVYSALKQMLELGRIDRNHEKKYSIAV